MASKGAIYTDNYFKYLFILMKYGADVIRRRIRVKMFIFLQYEQVKMAILNDSSNNRLVVYIYYKELKAEDSFEYIGQVNIYGYYPRQVRKILYNLQKQIRENTDGYRDRLKNKNITISRSRSWNYKRMNGWA
jgi:hypothetical protein